VERILQIGFRKLQTMFCFKSQRTRQRSDLWPASAAVTTTFYVRYPILIPRTTSTKPMKHLLTY